MKRIAILLLVTALVLCGCGQSTDSPETTAAAAAPTVEPAQEPATVATALFVEAKLDEGWTLMMDEKYEEAASLFTEVIEADPTLVHVLTARGQAYACIFGEESLNAAMTDFEAALAVDDTWLDAYIGIVDVYIRRNAFDEALAAAKTGLEKTNDAYLESLLETMENGIFVDSQGKLHKLTQYDEQGNCLYIQVYTYGENNSFSITTYDNNGTQTAHAEEFYDEEQRVGQTIMNFGDGTLGYQRYYKNELDQVIREEMYEADGSLSVTNELTYDEAGNLIKDQSYMRGSAGSYSLYFYNDKNQLIEEQWCYGDKIGSITTYLYNENDLCTEVICVISGEESSHTYNTYNDQGQLIETLTTGNNFSHCTFDYDSHDGLTIYTEYDQEGNVIAEHGLNPNDLQYFIS